jgi:hypothetical protein
VARKYLRIVLESQQFSKISFMTNDDVTSLPDTIRYDLCININSFAEMTGATLGNYLAFIAQRCHYFYTKNQVAKYMDKSLDGHTQGRDVVAHALNAGPLRDIIDIYDSRAVEAESQKFVNSYRPGEEWICVADSWALPWSSYWQAMYSRKSQR